jgi:hypothetical protein
MRAGKGSEKRSEGNKGARKKDKRVGTEARKL